MQQTSNGIGIALIVDCFNFGPTFLFELVGIAHQSIGFHLSFQKSVREPDIEMPDIALDCHSFLDVLQLIEIAKLANKIDNKYCVY